MFSQEHWAATQDFLWCELSQLFLYKFGKVPELTPDFWKSSFILLFLIFIIFLYSHFVYLYVYEHCACLVPKTLEKGVGCSGSKGTNACELQCSCEDLNMCLLKEQLVLLTAETSLQLPLQNFKITFSVCLLACLLSQNPFTCTLRAFLLPDTCEEHDSQILWAQRLQFKNNTTKIQNKDCDVASRTGLFFFFPDKALTENREMPWNIRKKSWREESLKSVRGYMEILFQRSVSSNFSIIFFIWYIFKMHI